MERSQTWIRSFSRRSRLKPNVNRFFTEYCISHDRKYIEKAVYSHKRIWLEIGFGNGEHILYQALNQPEILLIGCEPYLKGVSHLLTNVKKYDIKNILIWIEDARELIVNFPDNTIEKVFILFPDPWPKRSHNKRRLINVEFLTLLAKKMLNMGSILIVTDHLDYAEWIELHIKQCTFLTYREDDSTLYPVTKYYKKALQQQHAVRFFSINKLSLGEIEKKQ